MSAGVRTRLVATCRTKELVNKKRIIYIDFSGILSNRLVSIGAK